MALYHLGNLIQFGYNLVVHGALLKGKTHVGAGIVTYASGIYVVSRTGYDTVIKHLRHALVYGCA